MNPKDKCGMKKVPLHLIPAAADIAEAQVLALGAKKYGEFNWRDEQIQASVYVSAARRHLAAWFDGEDCDPESGVSHLAHVRACMSILLDAISLDGVIDDRPTEGAAALLIKECEKR